MKRCSVFPFILLLALSAGGATALDTQSQSPLVFSAGTHSLTVPWHAGPVTDRLNPTFLIGTERTLRPGGRLRLYQTANLGFFQHYWWMTGVFLDTELGVSHTLPLGFHADLRLGVGYLHSFWRRETLELKDGKYVHARDWGRPSLIVPLSIVIGYRGGSPRPLTIAPFISAQWAVQAPFTNESPVMTHLFLHVGVRINRGSVTATAGR